MVSPESRLGPSITALAERMEALPVRANAELRIRLIADVRYAALASFKFQRPAARQWMELAADVLERALFLRARERRPFEEFARQALLKALEKISEKGGEE